MARLDLLKVGLGIAFGAGVVLLANPFAPWLPRAVAASVSEQGRVDMQRLTFPVETKVDLGTLDPAREDDALVALLEQVQLRDPYEKPDYLAWWPRMAEFVERHPDRLDARAHAIRFSLQPISNQPPTIRLKWKDQRVWIQWVIELAEEGDVQDPGNAYWPLSLATAYSALGDLERARDAFGQAAASSHYNDYAMEEPRLKEQILRRNKGSVSGHERLTLYYGVLFQHLAPVKQAARAVVGAPNSQRKEVVLAGGVLMREGSPYLVGLVGRAMAMQALGYIEGGNPSDPRREAALARAEREATKLGPEAVEVYRRAATVKLPQSVQEPDFEGVNRALRFAAMGMVAFGLSLVGGGLLAAVARLKAGSPKLVRWGYLGVWGVVPVQVAFFPSFPGATPGSPSPEVAQWILGLAILGLVATLFARMRVGRFLTLIMAAGSLGAALIGILLAPSDAISLLAISLPSALVAWSLLYSEKWSETAQAAQFACATVLLGVLGSSAWFGSTSTSVPDVMLAAAFPGWIALVFALAPASKHAWRQGFGAALLVCAGVNLGLLGYLVREDHKTQQMLERELTATLDSFR